VFEKCALYFDQAHVACALCLGSMQHFRLSAHGSFNDARVQQTDTVRFTNRVQLVKVCNRKLQTGVIQIIEQSTFSYIFYFYMHICGVRAHLVVKGVIGLALKKTLFLFFLVK
jgi:hypothetical protein